MSRAKLTAWQRWEMDSFGPDAVPRAPRLTPEQQAAAEQLRVAMEQARQIGLREGHAEGLAQGREAGYQEGFAQAQAERGQLQALLASATADLARVNETAADGMLGLALDIAKAMLKNALDINPQLVLPVVQEALAQFANVQQPAQLLLHPRDAELVRRHMQDELAQAGWRLREDPQVAPGGCIAETATNQVDASAPSRWQRIAAALGRQDDWQA